MTVLATSKLAAVPPELSSRLGWDRQPPRRPAAELLEKALERLASGEDEALIAFRWKDTSRTPAALAKLRERVGPRLLKVARGAEGRGTLTARMLALEFLVRLGSDADVVREVARELPRTSGTIDLVDPLPAKEISPTRGIGDGRIALGFEGEPWLVGTFVVRLSDVTSWSPAPASDVWGNSLDLLRDADGRSMLLARIVRTDMRAKRAIPSLALEVVRLPADRGADSVIVGASSIPGAISLGVVGQRWIVVGGGRSLHGFDAAATPCWNVQLLRDHRIARCIGDSEDAYVTDCTTLVCVDPTTGAERWRCNVGMSPNIGAPLALQDRVLHVLTADGVTLLEPATGKILEELRYDFGAGFMIVDGHLWLWDGTLCLGEPVVSGVDLTTRRAHAGSKREPSITRTIAGTTVLFSPLAARWDGGGATARFRAGIGIGAVAPASTGIGHPARRRCRPADPWSWFELPL